MILTLLQNGDYETARTTALRELKNNPESAELHYFAAWAHDALGKEDPAIPFYEKALALGLPDADRKEAYIGLGSTYRITGQPEKASLLFQKALQEFPENNALRTFSIMAKYKPRLRERSLTRSPTATNKHNERREYFKLQKSDSILCARFRCDISLKGAEFSW